MTPSRSRPCIATLVLAALLSPLIAASVWPTAAVAAPHPAPERAPWFETFKDEADDRTLLRFLHAMPKGGDLHLHLGGSVHPEWLLQSALDAAEHGYRFLTKTRIDNCRPVGAPPTPGAPYLLMYQTLSEHSWRALPSCEQAEYEYLEDLDDVERAAWLDAIRLDAAHEGRDEFFEAHWQRMGEIGWSPQVMADNLVRNMQAFGDEGVRHIEPGIDVHGHREPDGTPIPPQTVVAMLRDRLDDDDARATGVSVRFELSVLRFLPRAEDAVRRQYAFVAREPDFVSVDLVGREDDDKGHPARFLDVFRELRRTHGDVALSLHGGEVDEPNDHVRDTLLLGADRVGHGVNLITDPELMLLMKAGPWLVEINLISNLLLEYVDDYAAHPFPEYLRFGIPVALSTDDRGMWDSTMSNEFFVAVKEFDLTWAEIVRLSRNSLAYSFAEETLKVEMLAAFDADIAAFEARFREGGLDAVVETEPQYRGFLCDRYAVCAP